MDASLHRLPPIVPVRAGPKAKVRKLIALFKGRRRALVVAHDNPDPDALAAAWGLCALLRTKVGVEADVSFGGFVGRSENKAFVRVLRIPIIPIDDVRLDDYDMFALVDTQQGVRNHSLPEEIVADIVIDHHPLREGRLLNPFADLDGDYGATSTMVTEYLRAAGTRIEPELATALYYGIKADTRDLERQTRDPDIDCYLWLMPRIRRDLLAQIEHPDLPARYFRLYHSALEKARLYDDAVLTDLGNVYAPDMVAEVAERLSFLESAKWSLAYGSHQGMFYLSLRARDRRFNAGKLLRDTCSDFGGSAGGHASMAGARLPLVGARAERAAFRAMVVRRLKQALGAEGDRGVGLLSADT